MLTITEIAAISVHVQVFVDMFSAPLGKCQGGTQFYFASCEFCVHLKMQNDLNEVFVCVCALTCGHLGLTVCDASTVVHQAALFIGFSWIILNTGLGCHFLL